MYFENNAPALPVIPLPVHFLLATEPIAKRTGQDKKHKNLLS